MVTAVLTAATHPAMRAFLWADPPVALVTLLRDALPLAGDVTVTPLLRDGRWQHR